MLLLPSRLTTAASRSAAPGSDGRRLVEIAVTVFSVLGLIRLSERASRAGADVAMLY